MSFDEKLFSWFYRKLPQGGDKKSALVDANWASSLGVVASSIFNRKVDVVLADEVLSFDHQTLVLNQRYPLKLNSEIMRRLYFYQMYFFRQMEQAKIRKLTTQHIPVVHRMVLEEKPLFREMFLELKQAFPEIENFLNHQVIASEHCSFIWPSEFVKSKADSTDESTAYTEDDHKQEKAIKAKTKKRPQKVKVTEQKGNPLVHVFEKVITIENFHGGDRAIEDAEDLAGDEDALQEITLDTMIRTQDQASGLIKSDVLMESDVVASEEPTDLPKGEVKTYPEWFYKDKCYRQDWVKMHIEYPQEIPVDQKFEDKVELNLAFEAPLWQKACKIGSEFDLPRVIDWYSTPLEQRDDKQRFYLQKNPLQEDSVFLFLIDQSLSTDTWMADTHILGLLKESIARIAPALEDALVPYAVASFSSVTRHNVQYSMLKDYDDSLAKLQANLQAIGPKGYTRIGPALRHSCDLLANREESKKYLILLSDCKPTDYDAYEGEHGYHDVLKAIEELRAQNIEVLIYSAQQEPSSWLRFRLKNAHFFSFKNSSEWLEQFFEIICLRR